MREFAKNLKKNNYDLVFDLHVKTRSIVISKELGVKTYRYKKRSWWKTLLVKLRLIKYSVDDTIIKNYFGAFKDLGLTYGGEDLTFNFSNKDLEKVKIYNNYIVLSPGASKRTKEWPEENFGKLAKLIKEKLNKNILLIGGKNEIEKCNNINQISGNICENLAGKLTLKESGALLSKADFQVTNDSGPFHIGRGVKTKSFVIFGPTDPKMFDYDDLGILIYKNEACSPCSLHGDKVCPKGHFNCMKKITPEMVMEIIEKNKG